MSKKARKAALMKTPIAVKDRFSDDFENHLAAVKAASLLSFYQQCKNVSAGDEGIGQ